MLTLLVLQGPDKGRRFELPDKLALIGRESRSLPLTDQTTSRRHCELIPSDGKWILRDLGSSNGTYVNGARVSSPHELRLGDQIRVGRSLMVFGAQPGVSRFSGAGVLLAGQELGMDASIMQTMASNDDSMVLAVPEPAAAAMNNLKLLYQLGAALGSSFDTDHVLEVVMDLVFEHVQADRGLILLRDEHGDELIPKVVRSRDENTAPAAEAVVKDHATASVRQGHKTVDREEPAADASESSPPPIHASRTIVNYVLDKGESVLSSNAMADHRFSKGKSVHNMGIRSVLCVPIKARKLGDREGGDDVIGVIYIDSSVKNYTYSPDQLRLLTAIGLQAGLAVQNAKLYQAGLAAERLAAIGETTAALSHSIKNILQALRGGSDVVEMGFRDNNLSQAQKGWRIVDRNLEKIYHLTMNLLAYSRGREPKLELVNPRTVIDECLELIASAANKKGVMAVADVDQAQPAVPLDADGLHQVLMNLLTNALDAVEEKVGLIRVICRFDAKKKATIIDVIDNGVGIPPSMMKHLFELFHSTKGNRGTGLGLAVARKIIEEHEGTITVRSKRGEGAHFTITLPLLQGGLSDPGNTHGSGI